MNLHVGIQVGLALFAFGISAAARGQFAQGLNGGQAQAGIRGVTTTNLTQNAGAQARNFFITGGVQLQPSPQVQAALGAGTAGAVASAPPAGPSDRLLKHLQERRSMLARREAGISGLIAARREARQPWPAEARQRAAVQAALRQVDGQIARRAAIVSHAALARTNLSYSLTPRK